MMNASITPPTYSTKTIVLRDVYYKDKLWYDHDRKPLIIPEFEKDIEYQSYREGTLTWPKIHRTNEIWEDISNDIVDKDISVPILFLDYIYGFYNFGEFWDVMRRLLVAEPHIKKLPLFHIENNSVTGIEHYFHAAGFPFKPDYLSRANQLVHFKEVYINTILHGCRGMISQGFCYDMNKRMNPEFGTVNPNSYKLYLTRGVFGRSILDEASLIAVLKEKYGFVILNGSESLAETIYYFSNASIILGAHSSLMKNMVWCMKNPVFIEMTPLTRSNNPCFVGNSSSLGFQTMYFICDCDEKEQLLLTEKQRTALVELIDILTRETNNTE